MTSFLFNLSSRTKELLVLVLSPKCPKYRGHEKVL